MILIKRLICIFNFLPFLTLNQSFFLPPNAQRSSIFFRTWRTHRRCSMGSLQFDRIRLYNDRWSGKRFRFECKQISIYLQSGCGKSQTQQTHQIGLQSNFAFYHRRRWQVRKFLINIVYVGDFEKKNSKFLCAYSIKYLFKELILFFREHLSILLLLSLDVNFHRNFILQISMILENIRILTC